MEKPNGWSEYQKLVLSELTRLNTEMKSLNTLYYKIQLDIVMLKVKSGAWGALGATIPLVIFFLIEMFIRRA